MSRLPFISRIAGLLTLAASAGAWAQSPAPTNIPDRLTTYVAYTPIDDGSFQVVVLSPKQDAAIHTAKPLDFCAKDAGYATVRNVEKLPYRDEMASVLGCWEVAGASDPLSAQARVTVKFYSPSAQRVRQFTLNGGDLKMMSFDWRTEKLYALTGR